MRQEQRCAKNHGVGQDLVESELRLRQLIDHAIVGIYRTTPDGRTLMSNPALVRMLGYESFEELAARNLEGTAVELPAGFTGEHNLVMVAFRREQQTAVDSWIAWYTSVADAYPGLRAYEVPVIATRWSPARSMIDGGMARSAAFCQRLADLTGLGVARAALEFLKEKLAENGIQIRYGLPRQKLTSIERDVIDMEIMLKSAWLMVLKAVWMADNRRPNSKEASMAKWFGARSAMEACHEALLIHGLTDSPYSMRALAGSLHARGFEVTVLRLPGHGTLPSMMTVHAPQEARSHTFLAPVMSRRLRKASSKVTRGSSFSTCSLPLMRRRTGTGPGPETPGVFSCAAAFSSAASRSSPSTL